MTRRGSGPHREETTGIGTVTSHDDGSDALRLVLVGKTFLESHALPAAGVVVVGRASDADVAVPHGSVSRRHAALHVGGTLEIEDLGSANGTVLEGRRLAAGERAVIRAGDIVEVGSVRLVVQRGRAPGPSAPPESRPRGEGEPSGAVLPPTGVMSEVMRLVDRVAPSELNVLVLGETGVGKDVVARALHARSLRATGVMLTVNCAALSETLLESELFGHEKGAFTGAVQSKAGLLETAHGGTVFLDEVGEMPLSLQPKLLRVLEDRVVRRVGGLRSRPIDVRFVAATNRDLQEEVAHGRFRRDLYFRLNGFTLGIPPLRKRRGEIAPLARAFASRAAAVARRPEPELAPDLIAALEAYDWPGNVRELRNVVERAVVLATGDVTSEWLPAEVLAARSAAPASTSLTVPPDPPAGEPLRSELHELERRRILEALAQCAGNQSQAARLLGMSRNTLLSRLRDYGVPRPRKR